MTRFDDQDRIDDYLRRQVFEEECFLRAYEMDPYTRIVYRRLRELYWTVSRLLKRDNHATASSAFGKPIFAGVAQLLPGPRIFIDATDLVRSGKATGIQRVVKEISVNAAALGLGLPVVVQDGRLAAACAGFEKIECREGDILLLLDAGWNRLDEYTQLRQDFRARGGKIVACLYDLFPLLYPTLYNPTLIANFQAWTHRVLLDCDAIVAISKSVADRFAIYIKGLEREPRDGMKLGWWRLGADFKQEDNKAPAASVEALARRAPFFLSVGTVETRKGYPVALEAFERLWAEGVDANFIIVGRPGWNAAAFENRLRGHHEKGRRLFWLDDASDEDLAFLYREARAVVLPTMAEGFGLPLVEAAHFGAPVIASDIDVFREIGGDAACYFDLLDAGSLVERIRQMLATEKYAPDIPSLSWRDSTVELMKMLREGRYQRSLG
ncbi:glycosyltransferase family 4 protein [Methylocystis sp. MJC1]|jgi:alpha-1,2-rhamnosyltransferase|uniref:glycosyltransferase family 4 protein n=1 Tax=Methylocystis sp. MJC1 TaxID=2654282 RepID=UPI0013EB830E|nr:glycosyltransferase family 1 protein [Methylocystis sp. MJC1]KAF2992723.1 D-inositol-3-phosphate glycosyltransferase [Methylocystis sp. MJC1]MBU6526686.1 glycosyltransferase family 4 protein [Methylocystis sp. MJC1]UZX13125.1 glycosyltransferase family 4 protein [Methylocystis sp. MJC1]